MRLRYLYCKRHIGFFQQLFRGLEKFIQQLSIEHWALGIGYSPCLAYSHARCTIRHPPILFPHT
ncbi:hypothetical protein [Nostoc sp.]|uniref:hypothetical protein n=1 Tax=Nostoc sp. TaxID=1180 RepID=UPI002FFCA4F7|nr:hypothetical protein [Nostoc sp. NMS9]